MKIKKSKIFLKPWCFGGLLSVSFSLNIKLILDSLLTFNEEFNIPLVFCDRENNTININNCIINNTNLYRTNIINSNKNQNKDEMKKI